MLRQSVCTSLSVFRLMAAVAAVAALFVPIAVDGANILAFVPMPLKSHFGGFRPMFEELARRGHNVTVVSSFPSAAANYTDVDVSPPKFLEFDVTKFIDQNFIITVMFRWSFAAMLSRVMDHPNIKELIQSEGNQFDVVMVESFFQEYTVALGHRFNAPVVNLAPAMMWVSISKWLHVPATYAYVPDCCVGITDRMGFVDRLKNTVVGFMETYAEDYFYVPKMKEIMDKHFRYGGWESRPALEQMLGDVSLTLMNAYHAVGVCRPYPPGVVEVGGMHITEPKPLPPDLLDYVESAEHGVVYFSFGSMVNMSSLPETKINIFLQVLGGLKQKVILKWSPDKSVKIPANVRTGSWLPQMDILAHPNVKLFVTHGGLHSIEEAVYNAKPLVGIPFFADQLSNLKLVEKNNFGKMLYYMDLTVELFRNAIEEVLSNPTFGEMAAVQSQVYRDQPMKPMDRAIYWIEYVVRHGGAKHLKSNSIGLNDAQYFLVDVALFFASLTAIVGWLCYRGVVMASSKCTK